MIFSFFAIPWVEKWRNRFHTSRFFSKEQLGKCWCGVLIHFSYNAINYIKTQLSHSFKILKYFSAKTQKDICGIPQSLSEKLHAKTSHLGSTRQELNKGNAQLVREPRCLSGQAPSASSRDANGAVQPRERFQARWNKQKILMRTNTGVFPTRDLLLSSRWDHLCHGHKDLCSYELDTHVQSLRDISEKNP